MDAYISGIEAELAQYSSDQLQKVSTIFWGGGTPGLLAPRDLERLGKVLQKRNWGYMDGMECRNRPNHRTPRSFPCPPGTRREPDLNGRAKLR